MAETIMQLKEKIREVAVARNHLSTLSGIKKESYALWEAKNNVLLAEMESAVSVCNTSEAELRELTLKAFAETGNKQPVSGVGIREVTKLTYSPDEALEWAMDHQIALSLDKKTFEGLAKTTPLHFVKITQEPQATIATDLSKYLEEKIEEEK